MTKTIKSSYKRSVIILTIILTVVFLLINISFYIINNNYLINKVEEENNSFLQITTHLLNENEIDVVTEYIEHYTHIHKVEIELLDDSGVMIFSSKLSHRYSKEYNIESDQGVFKVYIDNTDSITVNLIEENRLYLNLSLIIIYFISVLALVYSNNKSSKHINNDLSKVLQLIEENDINSQMFRYYEFQHIYSVISKYLQNIDLLTEQKEMNMKGLAHDVKTPLTIIYSYFEKVLKDKNINNDDTKKSFAAAMRINDLLNDLMDNNYTKSFYEINLSDILFTKINELNDILETKNISVVNNIEQNIKLIWNEKDYSRILENVISNAFHYSVKSSKLFINAYKTDAIYLEFLSEPSNLNDIDIEKIFKKGYRNTQANHPNKYGKGLGLYICKLLLLPLGGSISAKVIDNKILFKIKI